MIKRFFVKNRIDLLYLLCFFALELAAQPFSGARPYFSRFFVTAVFAIFLFSFLLVFKKLRLKKILSVIFLFVQSVIILATNFLYNSNGTVFEREMVWQSGDALETVEQLNISTWLAVICASVLLLYIVVLILDSVLMKKRGNNGTGGKSEAGEAYVAIWSGGIYMARETVNHGSPRNPRNNRERSVRIWAIVLCFVALFTFVILPAADAKDKKNRTDYYYLLYNSGNGTQNFGSSTNAFYELAGLLSPVGISKTDSVQLEEFLYRSPAKTSEYFGVSRGNNLVYVLVESFDTHVLERYDQQKTALLFPNITALLNDGVYATNFRNKEKTDTAEVLSLLGSLPSEKYVNYGYDNNAFPFSLPNLIKNDADERGEEIAVNSFHHNMASLYNRDKLHPALGFDRFFGIEDMAEFGMSNIWDGDGQISGERNLDSLAVECMKDEMFPADERFFSFFISLTMHGFYERRESLAAEGYYELLDALDAFPEGSNGDDNWRTYAAAVMDFDRAIGIMMDDLRAKNVLEDTTVVLFSDHDSYYNNLSVYANEQVGLQQGGGLDPERFRIPLIIYDQKLAAAIDAGTDDNDDSSSVTDVGADSDNGDFDAARGRRTVDKFCTTSDLLPTICDLLGIRLWKNMYFGSTIFGADKSIVYSRVYKFFFDDRVAFFTADDLRYKCEDFARADLQLFIKRAKTYLDKLYYMDRVYCFDYFANNPYRTP